MFTIPYNTTLFICGGIVLAVAGFWVYGFRRGWERIYQDEHRQNQADS